MLALLVWKREPWGSCSNTQEPTFTKVAPATPDNPDDKIELEKVEEAIVAPAVEDAVAKDITIPEIGTRRNCGILRIFNNSMVLCCKSDAWIIPTKVPVPNNSKQIPCILFIPKDINSLAFLILPVAIIPTIAPIGKAIKGSTEIFVKFPKVNKAIEMQEPIIEANKLGSSLYSSPELL